MVRLSAQERPKIAFATAREDVIGCAMIPNYTITNARPQDLARLPAIELAAARLLVGRAPESVIEETTAADVLEQAQREGHLWVALAGNVPVGFAHVELIERDAVHLEEIDVHPEHGRRGVGTRLVLHVCDWAARNGFGAVTLTTFRDVPWNLPFYARLGFDIVPEGELSPSLRAVVADETRRGLDPSRRVVMKRPSTSPANADLSVPIRSSGSSTSSDRPRPRRRLLPYR